MSLKDKLCRFRLVGPQSLQILRRVFVPTRFSGSNPVENQDVSWWWNLTGDHGLFEQQAEAWKRMESFHSASDLLPHSVYGLVVRDPRVAGQLKKQTVLESRCKSPFCLISSLFAIILDSVTRRSCNLINCFKGCKIYLWILSVFNLLKVTLMLL